MKHRIYHSHALGRRFPDYAATLHTNPESLTEAYQWMLSNDIAFEEGDTDNPKVSICSVNIEKRIQHPLARRFYALLRDEIPTTFVPAYGLNWATLRDRWLRAWEQCYNILINKLPSHHLRLLWLRMGGQKSASVRLSGELPRY